MVNNGTTKKFILSTLFSCLITICLSIGLARWWLPIAITSSGIIPNNFPDSKQIISLDKSAYVFYQKGDPLYRPIDQKLENIYIFSDYRCSYCKKLHDKLKSLNQLNKYNVIIKESPILGPQSELLANFAIEANIQGHYKEFSDYAFSNPNITAKDIQTKFESLKMDYGSAALRVKANANDALFQQHSHKLTAVNGGATPAIIYRQKLYNTVENIFSSD